MTKKQIAKIVLFLLTVLAFILVCNTKLNINRKEDAIRVYSFYKEPENSIDVCMIGCSELLRGYVPTIAYEEQGFTSYAFATAGMPMSLYKYSIMECENLQKPQLYIVEVNGVYYKDQTEEAKLRQLLDNMHLNDVKKEAIEKLVPKDKQSSFYFPFEKYHSNWKNIDDVIQYSRMKGVIDDQGYSVSKGFNADFRSGKIQVPAETKKHKMTEQGKEYFIELLEYLKEQNIENVLFVRWPHRNKFEIEGSYDDVIEVLNEYGYDFINFTDHMEEIGIDPDTDFADKEHLNTFGAQKMTKYLSNYIVDNYDITINHSEKVQNEWEYCSEKMHDILKACEQQTLQNTKKRLYTDYDYYKLINK